jgi:hypothetical protein
MAQALPLLGAGLLGVGGMAASSLLSPKEKPPVAAPAAPAVMPIADDESVRRARRRSLAMQLNRGGRDSTILSDGDTLGGG